MRRHSLHGPVVVILALVTVMGVLKSSSVLADDLDFTNITDVLSGKRQLLRVDDLAVVADLQPRPSVQVTNAVVLQTDNAKIVNRCCPTPWRGSRRLARPVGWRWGGCSISLTMSSRLP